MIDPKYQQEREDRRDTEMRARQNRLDEPIRDLQIRLHNREVWLLAISVLMLVLCSVVLALMVMPQ